MKKNFLTIGMILGLIVSFLQAAEITKEFEVIERQRIPKPWPWQGLDSFTNACQAFPATWGKSANQITWNDIFGLPDTAKKEEVRKKYQELSEQYDPKKVGDYPIVQKINLIITQAWAYYTATYGTHTNLRQLCSQWYEPILYQKAKGIGKYLGY